MGDPEFERAEMLENLGINYIIPAYQAFQASMGALDAAGNNFAADPTPETLEALQGRLKDARTTWQDVALFQFGPAETFALRGSLNTYPTDTDQINNNITSGSYVLGTLDNIDAGGFPALDYLINGLGTSTGEILPYYTTDNEAAARTQYVLDNISFIKGLVDSVVGRWLPGGGNFIGTFLSADKGGVDVGSSLGQLINAMILHYERFIRDGKIGIPAGVRSSGIPRPTTTEVYYGGYSLELAIRSMRTLNSVYEGTSFDGAEGIGLQENLEFLDAPDLASDISSTSAEIIGALEQLSDPLSTQIDADTDSVVNTFTKMQELVVLMKADMTSFLGITITFQDNDGD